MVYFFSFGRPKDASHRNHPGQPIPFRDPESSAGRSLISVLSRYARIECGFTHDTIWRKERPPQDAEKGLAALKLCIHTIHQEPGRLCRIEYVLTFSQSTDGKFHSIHRCWPSTTRGTPSFTEVGNTFTLNPSVPTPIGQFNLGDMSHSTNISQQSNWTVVAQKRQSKGEAGGRHDEVAIVWEALGANDRTTWADRQLCSSAVLRCELDYLTVAAVVYGCKRSPHWTGGFRGKKKILNHSSVRFRLTNGDGETDADTLCAELERWTNDENDRSVRDAA
jgi:hypothetical protein